MYEYQDEGVDFLRSTPRALLGDDPGLGKSRQALLAAEGRTLIVAPAFLAGVWRDEIERWQPGLEAEITAYSSLCARAEGPSGRMTRVMPLPRPEWRGRWDTIIADEAHYLKGRATTWTKAFAQLEASRLVLLTGTPVPNYGPDIYMLAKLLHEPGDYRWSSYWRWAGQWFDKAPNRFSKHRLGGLKKRWTWDDFVRGNLDGVYLARTRDEVGIDLPPLTQQIVEVDMVPAQARAYRSLRKDFLAAVDDLEVVCWTAGAQAQAMVRCATGLETLGDGAKGSGKLDAVREILASERGQPTILACHYRRTATALAEVARGLGLVPVVATGEASPAERFRRAKAFQEGRGDVLVAGIDALREGVTITRPNRLVFVEHSWSPYKNEQLMARLYRIGQDRPVMVTHLLTRRTVNMHQADTIRAKRRDQKAVKAAGARLRALTAREFAG